MEKKPKIIFYLFDCIVDVAQSKEYHCKLFRAKNITVYLYCSEQRISLYIFKRKEYHCILFRANNIIVRAKNITVYCLEPRISLYIV